MMPTANKLCRFSSPMRIIRNIKVEQNDVQQAVVQAPKRMECSFIRELVNYHTHKQLRQKDVEETIKIVLTSSKNYIRIVSIEVTTSVSGA